MIDVERSLVNLNQRIRTKVVLAKDSSYIISGDNKKIRK